MTHMRIVSDSSSAPATRRIRLCGKPALGVNALADLDIALAGAEADEKCRVVVISGDSEAFCTGIDVAAFTAMSDADHGPHVRRYARCLLRMRTMPQAVVCVVDGPALGGGLGLVAASDVAIAGPNARFALPELPLGLIPAVIAPLLCERLPVARVRWLALSGETLGPDEALAMGLVDQVTADPDRAVRRLERRLLRCRPKAVARLKRFTTIIGNLSRNAAITEGARHTTAHLSEREVVEALMRLEAGELPDWFARPDKGAS